MKTTIIAALLTAATALVFGCGTGNPAPVPTTAAGAPVTGTAESNVTSNADIGSQPTPTAGKLVCPPGQAAVGHDPSSARCMATRRSTP